MKYIKNIKKYLPWAGGLAGLIFIAVAAIIFFRSRPNNFINIKPGAGFKIIEPVACVDNVCYFPGQSSPPENSAGAETGSSDEVRAGEAENGLAEPAKTCEQAEAGVKDLISRANYCAADEDCAVITEFSCPFGCYSLVNKEAGLAPIRRAVENYRALGCPACKDDCQPPPRPEELRCREGKCGE